MATVSIIVPSYRGERFIENILGDLREQTWTDFEVLVVGNGQDQSAQEEIVRRFSANDHRVSYHSITQAGVSRSRNFGIDLAKGEWIAFVDVDDRVPSDWLWNMMVMTASSPDMVAGGISFRMVKTGALRRQDLLLTEASVELSDPVRFIPVYLSDQAVMYSPCSKLFRADFLRSAGLRFDEELSVYEDGVFSLQAIVSCKSIVFIPQTKYEYCFYGFVSAMTRYHDCLEAAVKRRRTMLGRVLERAQVPNDALGRQLSAQLAADSLDILLNAFHVGSPFGFRSRVDLARNLFDDSNLGVGLNVCEMRISNLPLVLFKLAYSARAPRLCVVVFTILFELRRIVRGV